MQKIILSPPFSNMYTHPKATNIVGTYTLKKRRGLWRVLTTLKRTDNGWLNNVGLRNPGIDRLKNKPVIVSISELEASEWDKLIDSIVVREKVIGVEFNVSCPNAAILPINEKIIARSNRLFSNTIVKLPHMIDDKTLCEILSLGEFIVHVSNTKQTLDGALSGEELICNNLKTIDKIKKLDPERKIIAGGGIYNLRALLDYEDVGADYFSLSTIMINPFKTYSLIRDYYSLNVEQENFQ